MMNFRLFRRCVTACMVSLALAQGALANPSGEAVQRGGTLNIALLGLDTADPHRHSGSIAVQQVFAETLTSVADDGQIKPFLAENFEISDDGKTYTFNCK
jgi:peptide/nickel transport system substrate-binding protein